MLKRFLVIFCSTLGVLWTLLEIIGETSSWEIWPFPCSLFYIIAITLGLSIALLLVDGYFFLGYLKSHIIISSNAFNTKIRIEFGDIFEKNGCKVIAVNDFFDSIVDENLVSSNSLHGQMVKRFWPANLGDLDNQISTTLSANPIEMVERRHGKRERFPVGTTAIVRAKDETFICVALSETNQGSNHTESSSMNLHLSVKTSLERARVTCSGMPLNLPILGAGLSRTGLRLNAILNLLLTIIFEESKKSEITNEIRVIVSTENKKELNLIELLKSWR